MSEVEGYELAPELKRKSLETIQWLINRVHSGQLTEEQFNTGVDTLFMAVSGLVQEPARTPLGEAKFVDIITACQSEIQNIYPVVKRVLYNHKSGMFKMFRWQAGDAFVDCTTCLSGQEPTTKRIDYKDPSAARDALDKVADSNSLKVFGYQEIGR